MIKKSSLKALIMSGCASVLLSAYADVARADTSEAVAPTSKGHYLSIAGDCAACHTNGKKGQPYAGGYPIVSGMGKIYSTNITPSKSHGIGNYSLDDFKRAVRDGVKPDGTHLYPAMPYPSYAMITDEDMEALYHYFMTEVPPVDSPAPQTELSFPFSMRFSMAGWNLLNSTAKPYQQSSAHDDAWNRGKYLVDGLAHCGECHTPRNLMMGSENGEYLAGAFVGPWFAPNLTSDPASGLGKWSDAELKAYLKTGKSEHARAAGPMAEAIEHGLQHLPDSDIDAIVAYLRTVKPIASEAEQVSHLDHQGNGSTYQVADSNARREESELTGQANGAALYEAVCSSCHQSNGKGTRDGVYPPLVLNATTGQPDAADLISTILNGVDRTIAGEHVLMPGFGKDSLVQPLTDVQVAAIATHIAQSFGNSKAVVTPDYVAELRAGGRPAPIASLSKPSVLISIGALGVAFLVLVYFCAVRIRANRSNSKG